MTTFNAGYHGAGGRTAKDPRHERLVPMCGARTWMGFYRHAAGLRRSATWPKASRLCPGAVFQQGRFYTGKAVVPLALQSAATRQGQVNL